jgi:glycosyltransferase involved in cell wall biosynthesis
MSSDSPPFFSVVIPTYNEASDILATLDAICANSFKDFEVLVVDASKDDTPRLVSACDDPRVRLLPQDNRDGRCGARNQGIRAARGEVAVILNADVILPPDFLERLKAHYDRGADFVIVDAVVENSNHPFGAMIEAEHHYFYLGGRETVNWCEGYSCRRRCAIEAGLFPEKLPVPVCAGEDAVFGENMAKRFRRIDDPGIVVRHRVPEDLPTFWHQRVGRGQGCTQRRLLIERWPLSRALTEGIVWTIKSLLWTLLLAPPLRYARTLSLHPPKMSARRLLWPILLSRIGHEIGRWRGFRQVLAAGRRD